jgi:hypothetical protein
MLIIVVAVLDRFWRLPGSLRWQAMIFVADGASCGLTFKFFMATVRTAGARDIAPARRGLLTGLRVARLLFQAKSLSRACAEGFIGVHLPEKSVRILSRTEISGRASAD